MCRSLKFLFSENLRKLNSLIYGFYLNPNVLTLYLYVEINVKQSIPFIWSGFNFYSKFFFELTINRLYLCYIPAISSVNDKLNHIINTILFGNVLNFCLNYFGYFNIKFFTQVFNVLKRTNISKVIFSPFIKCPW